MAEGGSAPSPSLPCRPAARRPLPLGSAMSPVRAVLALLAALAAPAAAYFVSIDAHAEECFLERVPSGTKMGLIFEVAEGGFLDIDVEVRRPADLGPPVPRCGEGVGARWGLREGGKGTDAIYYSNAEGGGRLKSHSPAQKGYECLAWKRCCRDLADGPPCQKAATTTKKPVSFF